MKVIDRKKLIRLRRKLGMKPYTFAVYAAVSDTVYRAIEEGKCWKPNFQTMLRISNVLGVNVEELVLEKAKIKQKITKKQIEESTIKKWKWKK